VLCLFADCGWENPGKWLLGIDIFSIYLVAIERGMGNSSTCSDVSSASPNHLRTRGLRGGARGTGEFSTMYARMQANAASQQLFDAAVRGDLKTAMMALVEKASPNCCNAEGYTTLMMTAANGSLDVARVLVTSGAEVNSIPNVLGVSALGLAAAQGSVEMVSLLLTWRAEPNVGRLKGNAPLSRAAASGHVEVCSMLLEARASVDAIDENGMSPVMLSTERQRLKTTQLLLQHGASMTAVDIKSCSTLSRAVDLLLKMDFLLRAPVAMRSPASPYDAWTDVCCIMAGRKADVNIIDTNGDTLLYRAVRQKCEEVVVLLLTLGADVNFAVPSLKGGPVLLLAVEQGQRDLCEAMVIRSANLNKADSSGMLPIFIALDRCDEEMCCYLLQRGAWPHSLDPRTGESVCLKAAAKGLRRLYDLLLPNAQIPAVGYAGGDNEDSGSERDG